MQTVALLCNTLFAPCVYKKTVITVQLYLTYSLRKRGRAKKGFPVSAAEEHISVIVTRLVENRGDFPFAAE